MEPASPVFSGRIDDGVLAAPVNLDETKRAQVGGLPFVSGVDGYGVYRESRWGLSPEDRATLARGGSILLRVWGLTHPMVSLAVWPVWPSDDREKQA